MNLVQLFLSPKGRIRRRTFWLGLVLPFCLSSWVVAFIDSALSLKGYVFYSWSILALWPAIAVSAKRWHDRNKAAWWVLITFVPMLGGELLTVLMLLVADEPSFEFLPFFGIANLIGLLWTIIECGFLPGTKGENRFGSEPA